MKKRLIISLIAVCLISFNVLILQKQSDVEKQKTLTSNLPTLVFKNIKGENQLLHNTPSVFIAFSPDCEHCQYEAKSINERQKELQNTNIVLFASANDSLTKAFAHTYGLDTIKNVQVISDKNDEMRQLFDVKTIPSIFIYNKDGQLVKQYKGETKIDAILKATQ